MKLFAKVTDPELLLRSLNELGTAFYRVVRGSHIEAVYFSASRTIFFQGRLTSQQLDVLKGQSYEAKKFTLNEQMGTIEVSQMDE